LRGSAWVVIDVWIVNRDSSIRKSSIERCYGHSSNDLMNTNYQREDGFRRALNQAIRYYRNNHSIGSDTEINYSHVKSGITNISDIRGKKVKKVYNNRIKGSKKRSFHKEAFLGRQGSEISRKDFNKMYAERTMQEYEQGEIMKTPTKTKIIKTKEQKYVKHKRYVKSRSTSPSVSNYRKDKRK
jgi:hypothetical protein